MNKLVFPSSGTTNSTGVTISQCIVMYAHRISFYAAIGFFALVTLLLAFLKIADFPDVPIAPFPSFVEIKQNVGFAISGRSNGYTRALHGYAVFAFMAGSFLSVGRVLMNRILGMDGDDSTFNSLTGRERIALYFMIGSVAYSLLWFGLGITSMLNSYSAISSGFVGYLCSFIGRDSVRTRLTATLSRMREWTVSERVLGVVLCLLSFLQSSKAVFYPIGHDTLKSHGALANYYLQHGALIHNPYDIYSYLSQNTEMLVLWSLLLDSEFSAQLVILGFWIAWMLMIWGFLKRRSGNAVSLVVTATVAAIPTVSLTVNEMKNDASVGLFIFAHYVYLVEALRLPPKASVERKKWFFLSGLITGGMIGHKLLGLLIAFFSFALLSVKFCILRTKKKQPLSLLVLFLLGVVVVAGPWFMRNWIHTGNPIYPLFDKSLTGPPLAREEVEFYIYDLLFGIGPSQHPVLAGSVNVHRLHPFWGSVYRPAWGPTAVFLILLAPTFLIRRATGFRLCWTAAVASYVFLAYSSPVVRYHSGVLVFLISTSLAVSWRSVIDLSRSKTSLWLPAAVLGLSIFVTNVWISTQPAFSFLLSGWGPGNYFSQGTRTANLYWVAHIFNSRSRPDDTVLLAGFSESYLFKRRVFASGALNPQKMLVDLAKQADHPSSLRDALIRLGVDHIVIARSFYKKSIHPVGDVKKKMRELIDGMLAKYMIARYTSPNGEFTWYSFRRDDPEIRLDAKDAEAFPAMMAAEIQNLRSKGRRSDAQLMTQEALRAPMMDIHRRKFEI